MNIDPITKQPHPIDLCREFREVLGLPAGALACSPEQAWTEAVGAVLAWRVALTKINDWSRVAIEEAPEWQLQALAQIGLHARACLFPPQPWPVPVPASDTAVTDAMEPTFGALPPFPPIPCAAGCIVKDYPGSPRCHVDAYTFEQLRDYAARYANLAVAAAKAPGEAPDSIPQPEGST